MPANGVIFTFSFQKSFLETVQRYTLGKNERMKSRKQIELLFKEGKSFSISPLRVYYTVQALPIAHCSLLFGVAVGTRNFKKAVDRNRIKRLIREAWRLQKNELQQKLKQQNKQLHVFFIFTGKEVPDYKLIAEKTGVALQKLEQLSVQPT
ncbi:ribonuclease P protein component [Lacibacter sp.]|uniref:ribonuclease P protein component n=1 Tax=Lacibacter sp. TaxID=1915409 RepID=UPI002B4B2F65|nr:ribonuclease P protein component [Lacibacter sp.]HLP36198.1 ribonuclease P protein component [Lacibacter sp.]